MKQNLIETHCSSRAKLDKLAIKLSINNIGPRSEVFARILTKSYREIKQAIDELA